ncbi:hypothetical protein GCM10010094_24550 [Streptomyces flaveus]|uniref:Uncharacterized protein n=1 Tax=Streptomyces flaveus TaxID=66370 RepID=A0A917QQ82_9ACTN|nr:hypothetical protein GCM10010094_24550 [Streptomyces flaveus]
MITQARERIDVLVYAAVFLHEAYPRLNHLLHERAAEGCAVRVAVGDAESENVQARGQEERFGHGIESRCRLALMHYSSLIGTPNIEVRTHGTTLYNSLYRADDQILVNAHVWGVNAYGAPVWHLRRKGSPLLARAVGSATLGSHHGASLEDHVQALDRPRSRRYLATMTDNRKGNAA